MKSKHQLDLERAHFLVTQAFDEDEKGNVEDAIELYTEAVDLCLKTVCITATSYIWWNCTKKFLPLLVNFT